MTRSSLMRAVKPSEAELLEHWSKLLPDGLRPLYITLFGDWFLETEDGEVLFLDTGMARVDRAASSRSELRSLLEEPENQQRWLLAGQVRLLRDQGITPGPGQCYSWKTPLWCCGDRADSGLGVDNVAVAGLDLHQETMSALLHAEIDVEVVPCGLGMQLFRLGLLLLLFPVALVATLVHLVRPRPAIEPA